MPELVVVRNENGKLEGMGEKGRRAWEKFKSRVDALDIGETLFFSYRLPRSPNHHRFFFARMNELLARQERFDELDRMLDWIKVGSGFAELMPGKDGIPAAIPMSIAWHKLEEQEFIEVHRAMVDFLWTPHAQAFLWPQLSDERRYEQVHELFGR